MAINILLVEDDAIIAIALQDDLGAAGYTVHHVVDGIEAISALAEDQSRFSGLITDIKLADDTDGWAVARKAREMMPHLPVIYVSGDSAHEHTSQGVPESVMLQKPFAGAQLITAISTLLNAVPPLPA